MRTGCVLCIGLLTVLIQACGVSPPKSTRLTRLVGISPTQLASLNCREASRNAWRPAANRERFCTRAFGETRVAVYVDPRERVYRVSRSWNTSSETRWRVLSDSVREALTKNARAVPCAELDDLPFVHTELMTLLSDLVELRMVTPSEDDGNEVRNYELRVAIVAGAADQCSPDNGTP
jgi:hypothetical protein